MLTSSNMFTNRIRSGVLLNIQRVSANAGWFTYRSLRGATRDDWNPPHDTFATEIRSQALRMSLYEWFLETYQARVDISFYRVRYCIEKEQQL